MPTITYNNFTTWINQDDKLGSLWIIDWNNVTWITTWEWLTLWPKVNKLFKTNGAMRGIYIEPKNIQPNLQRAFAFWDGGEIYNFESTDLTPTYTVSGGRTVKWVVFSSSDVLFLYESTAWSNSLNLWISWTVWFSPISSVDENYDTNILSHSDLPPILLSWPYIYIWASNKVTRFNNVSDPLSTKVNYTSLLRGWTIQWIGKTWNQFYLYSTLQDCTLWDWASTVNSGSNIIKFPPRKIHQTADYTYATSRDWEIYQWNGWNFNPIIKYTKSKRLEDNTQFLDKFNFDWTSQDVGQYITSVWNSIYVWSNDWVPWIYIYDNIIPWTRKGFHKAITKNHEWTDIDLVYAMEYDHSNDRVYFSYKAGTTYWVDYIETSSRDTAQTWYAVTQVFTGGTSFKKKINTLRIACENVDANNTVEVYYRVNDQDWELIRTINSTTEDIYYRDNMYKDINWDSFKEFIDVQFKFVINSNNWDNTPPIVNEFLMDYNIIEA